MSTVGKAVKRLLDRPGLRGVLGALVTRSRGARATGAVEVFWRNGVWVRRFADGYIIGDEVDFDVTPAMLDEQTRETWESCYSPAEGDVVVDVGAGIGTEVFRWAKAVGPTGRVIAIEAHPVTFGQLRLFCELNELGNVELVDKAVSDRRCKVLVEEGVDYSSASIAGVGGAVEVECVTLDDLLGDLKVDHIDFLKMNIEGAETAALLGASVTLSRVRHLCISCHDFRADLGDGDCFRTRASVGRLLQESGFTVVSRAEDDRPWIRDQVNGSRSASTGAGEDRTAE